MNTINDIHRRVFDVLLEHHYREEEAGREFYFLTEETNSDANIYHLDLTKKYIAVRLCGRNSWRTIVTLLISNEEQVYVCGRTDSFESEFTRDIYEILQQKRYNYKFKQAAIPGSYAFEIQENGQNYSINNIYFFLENEWFNIKHLLDKSIEHIWYITKDEFDSYLKTSAFYTPPLKILRKDLALKSLEVRNFKGIKHILLEDLLQNTCWIFLTGENGFGKTSVLQAIAAGLFGRYDATGKGLIPNGSFIELSYYTDNSEITNKSNATRKDASQTRLTEHLATYGSSRLQVSAKTTKEDLEKQSPPTYSLFNTDGVLLDVEQRLKETNAYFPEEFEQIVTTFQSLMPNLAKIEIDTSHKSVQVKYFEKDDEDNLINEGVTFTQLAAGYRNIIAMIGDMIYRLSTKQDVSNLSDLEGIVIIDELELHLHPKYQKLFVQKLTELFPHIQFIASTHSPIPLLGAPPETVILHVTRSQEKGIEVEKLDVDFSVLTPNAILTSPIFGFQELIPESKSDATMIKSEQTYQEVLFNDQLDKQIDEYLTEKNKEELLSLLKK